MNPPPARSADHEDVVLRFAGPRDLPAVADFLQTLGGPHFQERFPGRTAADFFRWKYLENPLGEAVVGAAMAGDRAVSTVAAVPKVLQVGADARTAYELGDFLTDERYRRRGLFSQLVEMVCSEAARRGAALAYVRPNENAFAILVRHLRFHEPIQLQARRYLALGRALTRRYGVPAGLVRLTGLDRVSRLALGGPRPRGFDVERVERFDRETDEFWERVRADYPFVMVRDSKYLNWRFADSPTPYRSWIVRRNGAMAGFLVALLSPAESAGYVLELFTGREDRASAWCLVRSCFRDLLDEGVRMIYTWTIEDRPGSASHGSLRRACGRRVGPPLHVAVRFLDASPSAVPISPRSSYFSLGDFDGT